MRIKSNEGITSQKSQTLRSICTGIGNATVESCGETNLSAAHTVVSLFAKNNGIYKSYKQVIDNDADHIRSIGSSFRNFDRNLMR